MHFFVIFFEKIPPACLDGNPPPFTREAESLRLALTATHLPLQGRRIPPVCGKSAAQPLRSDCAELQIKTSVRSCDKDRSCFERGKKNPRSVVNTDRWTFVILTFYQPITVEPALSLLTKPIQDLPVLS